MNMSEHGTCSYGTGSSVVDQKPYAYTFLYCSLIVFIADSGVASRKAMREQPAPWHLVIIIKITQKANDPMWASQHTVLYYGLQYTT